jgi:hypothetical protein
VVVLRAVHHAGCLPRVVFVPPHMNAFSEGYYAGLVGDAKSPHPVWSLDFWQWRAGNAIGLEQHRATIEAVYLAFPYD